MSELPDKHRDYLGAMMVLPAKKPHEKIAIFYEKSPGDYWFVEDAYVYIEHNKKFIADHPEGLWLSGAAGCLLTRHGVLAIYDDRIRKWKPSPIGWASPSDGPDLMTCLLREGTEELIVFSLDRKHQYVAAGVNPSFSVPSFGIKAIENAVVYGEFVPQRIHKKDGAVLVLHGLWDIRELPDAISIASDDEWWQGGFFGANVVTIGRDGAMTGYYSGQQGFVSLATCVPDGDIVLMLQSL